MVFEVAVPNAEYYLENKGGIGLHVTETLSPKGYDRQVNIHTFLLDIRQKHRPAQKM
jgi:hypothetical protein